MHAPLEGHHEVLPARRCPVIDAFAVVVQHRVRERDELVQRGHYFGRERWVRLDHLDRPEKERVPA